MAVSESRQQAEVGAVLRPTGLGLAGSGDHKVIGRAFIVTSSVFLLATLVVVELLEVDRVHEFLTNNDSFRQLFTARDISLVFLCLLPLLLGIALVVVPLQVGARAIAFPRAASLSYWAYLLGGVLLVISYAINGGPTGPRIKGVDLWIAAMVVLILALLLATICVVTTAIALRTPGMTLDRVPLFTWGMVASGVIWLLTLPVLIAALIIGYADHHHGRLLFGSDSFALYRQVLWSLRQPQVFAFAAPALGFAADVIPVAARARYDAFLFQYQGALINIGMFAVLGFGAFTAGGTTGPERTLVYIAMSFLVMLPPLALLGLWGDVFRRGSKVGRPQQAAALIFAVAAVLLLLVGGAAAATQSIARAGVQSTLFEYGQFYLVVLAGVLAGVGALHWWSTKIVGHPVDDKAGGGAAFLGLVGALALGLADIFSGGFGSGAEATSNGIRWCNYLGVVGGGLVLLAVFLGLSNVARVMVSRRATAPADPWEGHTLEWLTASPPAYENFVDLPLVTSEAPLLDRREAGAPIDGAPGSPSAPGAAGVDQTEARV